MSVLASKKTENSEIMYPGQLLKNSVILKEIMILQSKTSFLLLFISEKENNLITGTSKHNLCLFIEQVRKPYLLTADLAPFGRNKMLFLSTSKSQEGFSTPHF